MFTDEAAVKLNSKIVVDEAKLFKLQSVETAKQRIEEIKAERNKDLDKLNDLVAADQKTISECENAMHEAEKQMNAKAYRKAVESRDEAEILFKMHSGRKNALEKEPLIEEPEYNALVNNILNELDICTKSITLESLKLAEIMAEKGEILNRAVMDANKTLYTLQHDLNLDRDFVPTRNSFFNTTNKTRKEYRKHDETYLFDTLCVNNLRYNDLKSKFQEEKANE